MLKITPKSITNKGNINNRNAVKIFFIGSDNSNSMIYHICSGEFIAVIKNVLFKLNLITLYLLFFLNTFHLLKKSGHYQYLLFSLKVQ